MKDEEDKIVLALDPGRTALVIVDAPMKLPADRLPPGWATSADARSSVAPSLHNFAVPDILPTIARVRLSSDIAASLVTNAAAW